MGQDKYYNQMESGIYEDKYIWILRCIQDMSHNLKNSKILSQIRKEILYAFRLVYDSEVSG